jgi:hypothetical protein
VLYINKAPVFDNKEDGRFFILNGVEQLTGKLSNTNNGGSRHEKLEIGGSGD